MLRKLSYILSYIVAGTFALSAFGSMIYAIMFFVEMGNNSDPTLNGSFVGAAVIQLIGMLILAALAWFAIYYGNRVRKAYSRAEVKTISIVALFLVGILPGLFCLISEDSEYGPKVTVTAQEQDAINKASQELLKETKKEEDPIEKLKKLTELYDKKLISEEEYQEGRKKIIDKL